MSCHVSPLLRSNITSSDIAHTNRSFAVASIVSPAFVCLSPAPWPHYLKPGSQFTVAADLCDLCSLNIWCHQRHHQYSYLSDHQMRWHRRLNFYVLCPSVIKIRKIFFSQLIKNTRASCTRAETRYFSLYSLDNRSVCT